jgi:hypothetical protein
MIADHSLFPYANKTLNTSYNSTEKKKKAQAQGVSF